MHVQVKLVHQGYFFLAPPLRKKKNAAAQEEAAGLREGLLDQPGSTVLPKGYFAVYVGAEARRFVVPMSLLCQPAFRALM